MDVYIDEDLSSGLNDGSTKENAYQTFSGMAAGVGTLTENTTVFIYSTGVVDSQKATAGIDQNGYDLTFIFMDGASFTYTTGYAGVLNVDHTSLGTEKMYILNPRINGGSNNSTGIHIKENVEVNIVNPIIVGKTVSPSNGINIQHTNAVVNIHGGVIVTSEKGVYYTVGGGTINVYNTYIDAGAGESFVNSTNDSLGTINKFSVVTSDSLGSAGLTLVPYDNTNFTDVTMGAEDYSLPDGSALIGVGVETEYLTDYFGSAWGSPRDCGVVAYTAGVFTIEGVTYNKSGDIAGGSTVWLFSTGVDAFAFIESVVSDAVTGAFSFEIADTDLTYGVLSYLEGTPNIFDVSDINLTAEVS